MDLKIFTQDLSSDLAYVAQFSDSLYKQVFSVQTKANNAIKSGMPEDELTLDGSFFLSRELFDLDPTYFKYVNDSFDITLNRLKRLHSVPFGTVPSPTIKGPYFREWLANVHTVYVTSINLASNIANTSDGVTLAVNNRILLTEQSTESEDGIYTISSIAPYLSITKSTENTTLKTVKVIKGTTYGNTYWYNTATTNAPNFVQVDGIDGSNAESYSYQVYGLNYYHVVNTVANLMSTLKTTCINFKDSVDTLKNQTTVGTTNTESYNVFSVKANIDSLISTINTEVYNLELIGNYSNGIVPVPSYFVVEDRLVEAKLGIVGKPHKHIDIAVADRLENKTYNNNYSKSQGDGSGGTATGGGSMTGSGSASAALAAEQNQIMNDTNSIIEYWAQIGWMAAERANNYKAYIELLERDLIARGLEEIVEMHDKAVNNVYNIEKDLATGFLNPRSPEPLPKYDRPLRDKTLPWTDEELERLEPL